MNKPMGFRDLDIFQLAKKLAIEVHKMTLTLPRFELFEEGSQIRKSSKSVVFHIVEGFGRRSYKNEFLHFLTVAISECDETQVHLEFLYETSSLKDKERYDYFHSEYQKLAKMLTRFHSSVFNQHISAK